MFCLVRFLDTNIKAAKKFRLFIELHPQVVHLALLFHLTQLLATLVTVTGNGFDPISTVAITFDGSTVATVTSTSNGGFSATFIVPLSSSNGDHTVKATQGSNSVSTLLSERYRQQ